MREYKNIPIIIVGNKIDNRNIKVSSSTAKEFADKNGLTYYETSAKENLGIKALITDFTKLVYHLEKEKELTTEGIIKRTRDIRRFYNNQYRNN